MASASGAPDDRMEAFQTFLQSPTASDLVKKQVVSMTTNIKEVHDTTENYSRDVARKIEKIREIQRNLHEVNPEFTLTPIQVALLLQTDYTVLCDRYEERDFLAMMTHVEPFVRCCLGRPGELKKPDDLKRTQSDAEDESDNGRGYEMGDDEQAELGETSKRTKGEDGNEIEVLDDKSKGKGKERTENTRAGGAKQKVRIRDNNMCVFTESGPAEAAHIVPHTINKNDRHAKNARDALAGFLYAYRQDLWHNTKNLLFPLKNKKPIILASDMEWNMMLLYYDVHKLFDNMIVGFKPIHAPRRQDPDDPPKEFICVEWRYLPKRVGQAFRGREGQKFLKEKPATGRPAASCKMDVFHDELVEFYERNMQDSRPNEFGKGFPSATWKDGTLIESGHRFYIPAYKEDANKTFYLLEVMWLASQIASLSGAAEAIRYLRERPDDEWKKAYQAMEQRVDDPSTGEAKASTRDAEGSGREKDEVQRGKGGDAGPQEFDTKSDGTQGMYQAVRNDEAMGLSHEDTMDVAREMVEKKAFGDICSDAFVADTETEQAIGKPFTVTDNTKKEEPASNKQEGAEEEKSKKNSLGKLTRKVSMVSFSGGTTSIKKEIRRGLEKIKGLGDGR
ncbi:hypothetical protein F5X68DRAFT_239790 [Plectosphaerella plurivora]|uniref:HNH nuclease domain-containing protein n=1 Tax=Plectosphaerella plurivora TaxID=936078 RepID=A0A9P9AAD9_9PEZI|nr:hypothetical protein F5X68DRAFT_239790 [Plectosphaerella plurivora]